MNYSVNIQELNSMFALPSSVVDEHIKLSSEYQLKVLLIFIRNQASKDVFDIISKKLSLSPVEVEECLDYWVQRGVLNTDKKSVLKESVSKSVEINVSTSKPTREEAVNRIADCKELQYLTDVVQQKLARPISTAELKTLVWLYDCYGLPVPVIIMAIQYAIDAERLSFSYIEKVCVDWAKKDITTLQQAEEMINLLYLSKTAWNIVRSVFGIEKRKPTAQEKKYSDKWINEYEFSKDMLSLAYDICINNTAKLNFKYINTVLENWHKQGFETPSQVEDANNKKNNTHNKKSSFTMDDILKDVNKFD